MRHRILSLLVVSFLIVARAADGGDDSVLVIGDSNTEIGHVTRGLADALAPRYGDCGSGYASLASMGQAGPGVSAVVDPGWKAFDMHGGHGRMDAPDIVAPDGNWLVANAEGATVTITASGATADLYWLRQPKGGGLSVRIDGVAQPLVATDGARGVGGTRLVLGAGGKPRTITVACASLPVTLLGIDVRRPGRAQRRAVVHRWGNGYACTKDFLAADETVQVAAMRALAPATVVVLLGTNDHNIDRLPAEGFTERLKALVARIRGALPKARILLVSTAATKTEQATTLLPAYIATSYPEAAKAKGVAFWDMSTWLGPFDGANMQDPYHVNADAGKRIGLELARTLALAD
jgi:hypothetical protein